MRACVIALIASCGFSTSVDPPGVIDAPGEIDAPMIDVPPAMARYRKQIDIVDATIAGGPHVNFPYLVQWNADVAIAMHAKPDGTDIFFTLPDGTRRVRSRGGSGPRA